MIIEQVPESPWQGKNPTFDASLHGVPYQSLANMFDAKMWSEDILNAYEKHLTQYRWAYNELRSSQPQSDEDPSPETSPRS